MGYNQPGNPFEGVGARETHADVLSGSGPDIAGYYLEQDQDKQKEKEAKERAAEDRITIARMLHDSQESLRARLAEIEAQLGEMIAENKAAYQSNDARVLEMLKMPPGTPERETAELYKARYKAIGDTITVQVQLPGDKSLSHHIVSLADPNDLKSAYVEDKQGNRYSLYGPDSPFTPEQQAAFEVRIDSQLRNNKKSELGIGVVSNDHHELYGHQMTPEQKARYQADMDAAQQAADNGNVYMQDLLGKANTRQDQRTQIHIKGQERDQVQSQIDAEKSKPDSMPKVFHLSNGQIYTAPTQTIAPPSPDTPVISGPRKLAIADDVYTEYAVQRFVAVFQRAAEQMTASAAPSFVPPAPSGNAYKA